MRFRLVVDGEPHEIETDRGAKGIRVRVDGAEYRGRVRRTGDVFQIRIGTKHFRVQFEGGSALIDEARYPISISGIQDTLGSRSETGVSGRVASLQVRAAMPGRVVRVLAEPGARVKRGQTLVVLEAMKMQNEIPAPRDGIVREVGVVEGESITADRVVAVLEAR
jgi:biotin carboxyl carrier protein